MANDEQLAEHLAERVSSETGKIRPVRQLSDWSPVVELLTVIGNRLGELTQVVARFAGAGNHTVPPLPFPVTAAERVRDKRRHVQHRSLVARMLPNRPAEE